MNDGDKKDLNLKEKKSAKTSKTKKTVAKQSETKSKKVTAKKQIEGTIIEPTAKKISVTPKKTDSAATTQKVKTVAINAKSDNASSAVETVKRAKAKIDDVPTDVIFVEKTAPKAKKLKSVKAKTAETKSVAKKDSANKTTNLKSKKTIEKTDKDENSFPLEAKIQTQENFDLSETEVETEELSPVFKELADPKLPSLKEENRAYLQIQSPTRIFFYWSLKQDSYTKLHRALGSRANDYSLAVKLTNLKNNREEIHLAGDKGSWWFDNIEADTKYRAEVGFYAPNRPFVRVVFSNTLETPRQKPSANTDYQPYFTVTATEFAEVLDLAGFSQDAFEVYVAGDEPQSADEATQKAFVQLAGEEKVDFSNINVSELRYILFALASGVSLFSLKEEISLNLFDFLANLTKLKTNALTEEKVILALEEFFGVSPVEESAEEEILNPIAFGASLINFPKQLRKKTSKYNPKGKLNPLSSFSLK